MQRPARGYSPAMPELSEHDQAGPAPMDAGILARRLERVESALRQVDDELETLRHAVAHDLRAPLRAIEGFSRAVLEDHGAALPDAARADLERVRAAGARMARLVDEFVGMLHAALLTSAGIDQAVDRTVESMIGRADLRIAAFQERGLSDETVAQIEMMPGVAVAAQRS